LRFASDPDFSPVVNRRVRCSGEPWVNMLGSMTRCRLGKGCIVAN
jgi:hypothetical protein